MASVLDVQPVESTCDGPRRCSAIESSLDKLPCVPAVIENSDPLPSRKNWRYCSSTNAIPPPPVQNFSGGLANAIWQGQFLSRTNWIYTLQRTTNLVSWDNLSSATNGNGTNLFLPDNSPPRTSAYYRIRADHQ